MIRTERLLLRRWRASDRAPFAALNADPRVMEHFPHTLSTPESDAFTERIDEHWRQSGWGLWAVELPGLAPFVGYVGLWPTDVLGEPGGVEVGWRLAREHWGKGYATEGAHEALRFGFEELDLPEIVSFTVPQNERSRRVMERIGMHHDRAGDFDHPRVDSSTHPELVRHVLYRLRRGEWRVRISPA